MIGRVHFVPVEEFSPRLAVDPEAILIGLHQSSNRSSVMYGPIFDLDDLDSVGEDF